MPRRWRSLLATLVAALLPIGLLPIPDVTLAALASPTLTSPAQGATAPVDATLTWLSVDGAIGYQVQLGSDAAFSFVYRTADTVATSIDLEDLFSPGPVYWRVAARDASGLGPWSAGTFTAQITDGPVPTAPANGTQFQYPRDAVVLSWQPSMSRPFDIEINGPFGLGQYITFASRFAVPNTLPPGTYSWRVRSSANPTGVGWSTSRSFEVVWPNAIPVIVGPASGATAESPILDWDPIPGIDRYDVEIGREQTFPQNTTTRHHGIAETMLYVGHTSRTEIRWWRLRGRFGGNTLPWSAPRSFTHAAWSDAPTDLWPNGTSTDTGTLRWAPVAGADSYLVQRGPSVEALMAMEGGCETYVNAISLSGLSGGPCAPSGGDYWRVRGLASSPSGGAATAWSEVAHGSLAGPPGPFTLTDPVIATPIVPADCANATTCVHQTEMPLLRWQPVSGAAFYRVQLDSRDDHLPGRTWDTFGLAFIPPLDAYRDLDVERWSWQVVACGPTLADCPGWMPASANLRHFAITPRTIEIGTTKAILEGEVTLTREVPLPGPPAAGQPWEIVQQTGITLDVNTSPTFDATPLQGSPSGPGATQFASLPAGPVHWRAMYGDRENPHGIVTDSFTYRFEASDLQPSNGTSTQTPAVVRWTPVAGAVSYSVEVETPTGWRVASNTPWAGALIGEDFGLGPIDWRLTPVNARLQGGRSVSRTLVVAPQDPALTSPANGANISTIGAIFDWAPIGAAAEYRLEVGTDAGFSAIVETVTTFRSRYVARVEYPTGTLWWRVRAFNRSGLLIGTSAT